jgi:hypothetical protein
MCLIIVFILCARGLASNPSTSNRIPNLKLCGQGAGEVCGFYCHSVTNGISRI